MPSSTNRYYDDNAKQYSEKTLHLDLRRLYEEFLFYVPDNGSILDVGCGSGRDSKYFSKAGYDVISIDSSKQMCNVARQNTCNPVYNLKIQDITCNEKFNGVWACASLLHIPQKEINDVIRRIVTSLKVGGVLYASWKLGAGEHYDANGRFYSDFDEKALLDLFGCFSNIDIMKIWITNGIDNNERSQEWINAIVKRVAR